MSLARQNAARRALMPGIPASSLTIYTSLARQNAARRALMPGIPASSLAIYTSLARQNAARRALMLADRDIAVPGSFFGSGLVYL